MKKVLEVFAIMFAIVAVTAMSITPFMVAAMGFMKYQSENIWLNGLVILPLCMIAGAISAGFTLIIPGALSQLCLYAAKD